MMMIVVGRVEINGHRRTVLLNLTSECRKYTGHSVIVRAHARHGTYATNFVAQT